jgi:hypothetical protein
MWKDPIVEEVRAIRDAIAKKHNYNLREIIAHLQKRSRDAGRKTVTLRRKRVAKPAARAKPRRRRTA